MLLSRIIHKIYSKFIKIKKGQALVLFIITFMRIPTNCLLVSCCGKSVLAVMIADVSGLRKL